jgi:hypothetical protein
MGCLTKNLNTLNFINSLIEMYTSTRHKKERSMFMIIVNCLFHKQILHASFLITIKTHQCFLFKIAQHMVFDIVESSQFLICLFYFHFNIVLQSSWFEHLYSIFLNFYFSKSLLLLWFNQWNDNSASRG